MSEEVESSSTENEDCTDIRKYMSPPNSLAERSAYHVSEVRTAVQLNFTYCKP